MAIHNCRPSGFSMYNRIIDSHCCGGGGNNYGSIYNIKYDCNGGINFGGALGLGLSAVFGDLFGSMFGGFGMGMPGMFSGWGNGLAALWGGGASGAGNSNTDYVSKYTYKKDNDDNKPVETTPQKVSTGNADTPRLRELTDNFDSLLAKKIAGEDITADVKTLIEDLGKLIEKPVDEANELDDKNLYEKLKSKAEKLANGTLPGVDQNIVRPNPELTGTGYLVKINNVPINSVDDLNKFPPAEFADLVKDMNKDTAIAVLVKVGYLNYDATSPQYKNSGVSGTCHYLSGKMSKHPNVLMLLSRADVAVEAYRGSSDRKDNWVTGTIPFDSINYNESGALTAFNVDCKANGHSSFQGAYTFAVTENGQTETKFKVTTTDDNNVTKIHSGGDSVVLKKEKEHATGSLLIDDK